MNWVLIIAMHVGPMSDGNSNALTNVSGFKSKNSCELAGKDVSTLMEGTVKNIRYKCIEVK